MPRQASKSNLKLSVVIPAYNEEENIRRGALESVFNYLNNQKYPWEVLVVDDGSSDSTAHLVDEFVQNHQGFKILREPHRGKAGAVMAGVLSAKGQIVLFTDMDQATPIDQLKKFLLKFEQGFDLVIGKRTLQREGAPFLRKVMAWGFIALRSLVLRLPYKDTQCGFKAFRKEAAENIFKKMRVFSENEKIKGAAVTAGFDLELLYLARKLGLKVAEVPVKWHHKGTVRINPLKDSWQGLRDMLRVRGNALLGKYQV